MRRLILIGLGVLFVGSSAVVAIAWTTCRIFVPEDKCAILIKRTGEMLPESESVATNESQRGIQQEVLGPGRYFRDPIRWDWKVVNLTAVPCGDAKTWSLRRPPGADKQRPANTSVVAAPFKFVGDFPRIGVVTRKVGKKPPPGRVIVSRDSGYQGILEEVLTPGIYKINPFVYEIELYPAVVIPAGFVGVVTNLFGADQPAAAGQSDTSSAYTPDMVSQVRPLAEAGQRGTLRDVLQPGIYFINPKLKKVTLVEIGFNEYSQLHLRGTDDSQISFPSDTGYLIRVGVTVVWGIDPAHAAEIINEFGNVDRVLDKVIAPQLRSICRNIGSTYAARDFIQGEKRELFQKALTVELQRICRSKNIEVLLALVREIEVHAPTSGDKPDPGAVTEDLKRTIQQSYIAIENQITKEKQREAATVKAHLQEVKKRVDIAQETVRAETRVMTANILAEGRKAAAMIDAQADLEVATVQQEVAQLEARRIEILGQANANVERVKKAAEATGYKMLVDAFGSAHAFNLYTFADNFQPDSIRLIFAGDGTFWTDLSRFEDVGAAKLLQPPAKKP